MNNAIYNINVKRYVQRLMSRFDKNQFNVHWLVQLVSPLNILQIGFRRFSIEQRANCFGNSQTGLLSARLNELCDPVLQRIYIVNHTLNNTVPLQYHFTVFIPLDMPKKDPDFVQSFVSEYVLLDKFFQITIF